MSFGIRDTRDSFAGNLMVSLNATSAQAITFFITPRTTALALEGALARTLELLNKIGTSREDYFIVSGQ